MSNAPRCSMSILGADPSTRETPFVIGVLGEFFGAHPVAAIENMQHEWLRASEYLDVMNSHMRQSILYLLKEEEYRIEVYIMDISKQDLGEILQGRDGDNAISIDLNRRLTDRTSSFEPMGLLVGAYKFDNSISDLDTLEGVAALCARYNTPFISDVSPSFFGRDSFGNLFRDLYSWKREGESEAYAAWRRFRDSEESRFVALALPSIPLNSGGDVNAAIVLAARMARSFSETGLCAAIRGETKLPEGYAGFGHDACISDPGEHVLSDFGLTPLVLARGGRGAAWFLSCQTARRTNAAGEPSTDNQARATLPAMMVASRFMQHLTYMAYAAEMRPPFHFAGPRVALRFEEAPPLDATVEQELTNWTGGFRGHKENSDYYRTIYPLGDVEINVELVPGADERAKIAARFEILLPHGASETVELVSYPPPLQLQMVTSV